MSEKRINKGRAYTSTETPQKAIWDHLKILQQPAAVADIMTGKAGYWPKEDLLPDGEAKIKGREISSLLVQAEEFFISAERSTLATRPLQLYYGVLCLAKSIILSQDTSIKLQNLKYHGLATRPIGDDQRVYSESPSAWNLLDEFANVNEGVFKELVRTTHDFEIEKDVKITLGSLLSTDPEISVAYDRFENSPSLTFPIYDIQINENPFQVFLYPSTTDAENFFDVFDIMKDDFSSSGKIKHSQAIEIISNSNVSNFPRYLGIQKPNAGGRFLVGPCVNDFKSGQKLHLDRSAADFASLFILSTLVRYRSELWTDIIRGERKGNLGLISLHLNAVTRRFPQLALSVIFREFFDFGVVGRLG